MTYNYIKDLKLYCTFRKSIREEISALKKQYKKDKSQKTKVELSEFQSYVSPVITNELIEDYVEEQQKYSKKQKFQIPKNLSERFVLLYTLVNLKSLIVMS